MICWLSFKNTSKHMLTQYLGSSMLGQQTMNYMLNVDQSQFRLDLGSSVQL